MKKVKTIAFLSILMLFSSCSRVRIIDKGVNNSSQATSQISQDNGGKDSQNKIDSQGGTIGLIEDEYTNLLTTGMGELYPCQYVEVYYEQVQDYKTVGSGSLEDSLIVSSGGMNIGSYVLDASKINPDYSFISSYQVELLIKCVSKDILGSNIISTDSASGIYSSFIGRTDYNKLPAVKNQKVVLVSEELLESSNGKLAFKLLVAKLIYPSLFTNLNISSAYSSLLGEGKYFLYYGTF